MFHFKLLSCKEKLISNRLDRLTRGFGQKILSQLSALMFSIHDNVQLMEPTL